jgi:hypothetical protein
VPDYHLSQLDAASLQMEIEMQIASCPGHRLASGILAARIHRGLVPGDVVRHHDHLVEYHGDGTVTVIYREYRNEREGGKLVETGRETKPISPRQCMRLLLDATLEAHADVVNRPSGVHHAFTGTAYNPATR